MVTSERSGPAMWYECVHPGRTGQEAQGRPMTDLERETGQCSALYSSDNRIGAQNARRGHQDCGGRFESQARITLRWNNVDVHESYDGRNSDGGVAIHTNAKERRAQNLESKKEHRRRQPKTRRQSLNRKRLMPNTTPCVYQGRRVDSCHEDPEHPPDQVRANMHGMAKRLYERSDFHGSNIETTNTHYPRETVELAGIGTFAALRTARAASRHESPASGLI